MPEDIARGKEGCQGSENIPDFSQSPIFRRDGFFGCESPDNAGLTDLNRDEHNHPDYARGDELPVPPGHPFDMQIVHVMKHGVANTPKLQRALPLLS